MVTSQLVCECAGGSGPSFDTSVFIRSSSLPTYFCNIASALATLSGA